MTGTVFGLSQGWLQLISDPLGLFPLRIKTLFTETQHSVNINPPDLSCHSVTLVFFFNFQSKQSFLKPYFGQSQQFFWKHLMSGLYMWFLCLGDNVLYIITTKTAFHESCRRGATDESILWRWRLSCPVQKIVTSSTFNTPSHPDFKGSIKVCFSLSFSNRNWFHVFIYFLCHHKVMLEVANLQLLLFARCPLLP